MANLSKFNEKFPWIQIFVVFSILVFIVSILISKEIDKGSIPANHNKVRSINSVIYTLSLIVLTSMISIFFTRQLGCRESTSGKSFAIVAEAGVILFSIIVLILYISILNNSDMEFLKNTNVKSYVTMNVVIISMALLFGGYTLYESIRDR